MASIFATVITDASFCPDTKAAAWAGWVKVDGVREAIKGSGRLRECSDSTLAETMAAANGIWMAASRGARHILIQSDCMAVIHLVEGKSKSPRLLEVMRQLRTYDCMRGVTLSARHVKGHGVIKDTRTWVNDWCDKTAGEIMGKQRAQLRRKTGQATGQSGTSGRGGETRPGPSWGVCPRP